MPTARKATSFTSDSKAMAATIPSWRSEASRWRVPNRMVNVASSNAIQNAVSAWIGTASRWAGITTSGYWTSSVKLFETAFSCSAMYGTTPITAITVTSPASSALLP